VIINYYRGSAIQRYSVLKSESSQVIQRVMSTSKRKFHEAFGKREVEFDKTCFAGSKVEVPTSVEDFEATLEKASAAGRIVVVAFIKEKVLVCYHLRKTFYEMSSRFAEVQFLEVSFWVLSLVKIQNSI